MAQFCVHSSGQLFDFADPVDLLPEPLDPQKILASLRGIDLYRIAPYISSLITSSRSFSIPGLSEMDIPLNSSGLPRP